MVSWLKVCIQLFVSCAALALGCVGATSAQPAMLAQTNDKLASEIPDVAVQDQDGKALRFYTDIVKGRTVVINFTYTESTTIGPEGALGLMAAVAPRQSLSRAIVQTPLKASRIGAERLHEAWSRSPALRHLVDRHTEALYGHAIQSVACNALHSVEERFCRWLLTCHDRISSDTVALTQEFLADMLGVQRTTVTAVARSLQDKGIIRYRRGIVDIIDRPALQQLTCECYGAIRGTYHRLLGG